MPDKVLSGGDKLRLALAKIAHDLGKKATLSVGFLGGKGGDYIGGTPVALVAAVQEFGSPRRGIPPRPFFRPAIAKHSKEWPGIIREQLKKTDNDVHVTLDRLGAVITGEIQDSIRDVVSPALSPVTLMVRQIVGPNGKATFADVLEARRRVAAGKRATSADDKPLIWTANLLNSVTWKIED